MTYKTKKWQVLEVKDVTDYVRDMLKGTAYGTRYYKITNAAMAQEVKKYLDNPANTRGKSMRDIRTGIPYWNRQEVAFVPSNLGRGVLWYFLCNYCGNRARYLYQHSQLHDPLCRQCLEIGYERRPNRRRVNPQEYPQVIERTWPRIDERRKKPEMAKIIFTGDPFAGF